MKKLIGAVIGIAIVLLGAWLSGYNFDSRGATAFHIYALSMVFALLGVLVGSSMEDFE